MKKKSQNSKNIHELNISFFFTYSKTDTLVTFLLLFPEYDESTHSSHRQTIMQEEQVDPLGKQDNRPKSLKQT